MMLGFRFLIVALRQGVVSGLESIRYALSLPQGILDVITIIQTTDESASNPMCLHLHPSLASSAPTSASRPPPHTDCTEA